jgi:hypothetical protein
MEIIDEVLWLVPMQRMPGGRIRDEPCVFNGGR